MLIDVTREFTEVGSQHQLSLGVKLITRCVLCERGDEIRQFVRTRLSFLATSIPQLSYSPGEHAKSQTHESSRALC